MKTANAKQTHPEKAPSEGAHTVEELLRDLGMVHDFVELIHGERQAAQTSVYSMKAVLNMIDIITQYSHDEIDLVAIIHIFSGLVENTLDSLTMIEERTREIQGLC